MLFHRDVPPARVRFFAKYVALVGVCCVSQSASWLEAARAETSSQEISRAKVAPSKTLRAKEARHTNLKKAKNIFVYIGTYTDKDSASKGIYVYRLDAETGKLHFTGQSALTPNPSFLAISPNGRNLYAANEVSEVSPRSGAGVSAFAIDAQNGALKFLNWQSSRGAGTCYVAVAPQGNLVAAANYSDGSVAAYRVLDNGSLRAASFFEKYSAAPQNLATPKVTTPKVTTPNVTVQNVTPPKNSYAHSFTFDASGRFAFVCDLGLDRIVGYKIEPKSARITPNTPPFLAMRAASGPRHFAFHPSQKFAYSSNELDSSVSAFLFDAAKGALRETQHISTLPPNFSGENSCADVHLSPDGRFLYASNRGHNSLAIFVINPKNGHLTLVAHVPTRGKKPRSFALDASGKFAIVANQNSNNLVIFRRDAQSGLLSPTGQIVEVPSPVCVRFGREAK